MTYQYRTIVNLLWSEIINNEMAETIYMANEAKTKFTFIPKSSNLYLSLSGFNSALLSSFHEIISKFNKIIPVSYKNIFKLKMFILGIFNS